MEFGRRFNVTGMKFPLPEDPERTSRFLEWRAASEKSEVYVGLPLWGFRDWTGSVYPVGTSPQEYLYHYSRQFNSIELNSTYYHSPSPQQVKSWANQTPSSFRFCPKLPQAISQGLDSFDLEKNLNAFTEAVLGFDDRLGVCFAQFQPDFDITQTPLLHRFFEAVPDDLPLAVELRHGSFFDSGRLKDPIIDLFYRNGVTAVITDTAGRRDVLHLSLTYPKVMIRFLGNHLHETDVERLQEWAARVHKWTHSGIEETYFFVHQADESYAPDTANLFIDALNERTDIDLTPYQNYAQQNSNDQFSLL